MKLKILFLFVSVLWAAGIRGEEQPAAATPASATTTVRVAAAQAKRRAIDWRLTKPADVLAAVNRNLDELEQIVHRAGEQKCDALALPEDTLGLLDWYGMNEKVAKEVVPAAVRRMIERLGGAAAKHRMYLVVCSDFIEADGGTYNTAFLLGRDGQEIGRYHKVCPTWSESGARQRGQSFPVFATPDLGTVGLTICYDLVMPETARCLALAGADILFFPTMGGAAIGDDDIGVQALRVRAAENQVWLAVAFRGSSAMIISPRGKIIARAEGPDGLAVADIDPHGGRAGGDSSNWQRDMRARLFRERNPAAFGPLTDANPPVLSKVPIDLTREEAGRIFARMLTVGEEEFRQAEALARAGKTKQASDAFEKLRAEYRGSWIDRAAGERLAVLNSSPQQEPDDRSQKSADPTAADLFPKELVDFVPDPKEPVFTGAGPGHWDVRIRERGWIMREGGLYRMWYTGFERDSSPLLKLGYATSTDGIHWTRYDKNPVYGDHWVEDMMVVRHDGTYYMFAEGKDDLAQLLTSADGIAWKRIGQLDVRMKNGEPIEPGPYGTPTAWFENGVWHLFYERRDLGIWLATSNDLKVWTNVQDEPVISLGPADYDKEQVALNQIVKHNGRYYAYYHGAGAPQPGTRERLWCTCVATSKDLVRWEKYEKNPLFPLEENKSSGILVHDGRQFLLYTMHDQVRRHVPRFRRPDGAGDQRGKESPAHLRATAENPPPKKPAKDGKGHQPRPLPITGSSQEIVQATISGPQFHAPELFQGFEDSYNPRLRRLRQEYKLDEVVEGEPDEFRRILKLRHWVHSRWPIDNDQNFSGDAFAILEKAKTGCGFHCAHSMIVQQAVLSAMGFVARNVLVDRDHRDLGKSAHHGVNEVWSNDHAKWVLLDAKYDIHFERDGVPLSALELHEAVRADGGRGIVMVEGTDRRPVAEKPEELHAPTVRSYWWVCYPLRQNPFTQPHFAARERLVIFDNEAFRKTTWHRDHGAGLTKHWAYAAGAFLPTADRHQIEWTPSVPALRARCVSATELEVEFRSATPNFEAYVVRLNGGHPHAVGDGRLLWKLTPGQNTLQVHSRNLFGVAGSAVTATAEFQPEREAGFQPAQNNSSKKTTP